MVTWNYSMISELEKAYEESGRDIKSTAKLMGLSISTVDSAVRRYFKKDTAQYKRRINTGAFRITHGKADLS